jgi:hypothetical protein
MATLAHLPDYFEHRATLGEKDCTWYDGTPIPWLTYPAICYLEQLDFSRRFIFEYGCGSSTRYWARTARTVTSVEHDKAWFDKISAALPENVELFHKTERAYIECVKVNAPHNVIVIDGRWRPECSRYCLPYLAEDGIVILDNSERHPDITEFFREKSLIQVDFVGHGPINGHMWVTSMFLSRSASFSPRTIQPRYLPGIPDAMDRPR